MNNSGGNKLSERLKKKKKRKPAGVMLFSMIILIITGFVVFRFEAIAGNAWNTGTAGAGTTRSIPADYEVGFEDQTMFFNGPGYIVKSDDEYLRMYDHSGAPIWEKPLNAQGVIVKGTKSSVAVIEPVSGDVFLLNSSGNILAKKFALGQIVDVLYPSDGYLVCRMSERDELLIFDANLENYGRIPLPDGEILDIGVSATEDLIALTMFRLENGTYHSQILTYKRDGQPIGAINLKDKFILDFAVIKDQMIGVTDAQVFSYNISNELNWEVNIDRAIKKASICSDGTTVLNLIKSGEDISDARFDNVISYVGVGGEAISEVPIDYEVEKLKRRKGHTVFSTVDRIYILNENGKMDSIVDTGGNLRDFEFVDDDTLGVEYGDRLDIIKLK